LKKKPYFPLYWLVYRDPYIGPLLFSLYSWVGFHPKKTAPSGWCFVLGRPFLEVAVARVLRVSDGYQIRADRKWCDRFAIAVAMEESILEGKKYANLPRT